MHKKTARGGLFVVLCLLCWSEKLRAKLRRNQCRVTDCLSQLRLKLDLCAHKFLLCRAHFLEWVV